jgi:hypothetical protein
MQLHYHHAAHVTSPSEPSRAASYLRWGHPGESQLRRCACPFVLPGPLFFPRCRLLFNPCSPFSPEWLSSSKICSLFHHLLSFCLPRIIPRRRRLNLPRPWRHASLSSNSGSRPRHPLLSQPPHFARTESDVGDTSAIESQPLLSRDEICCALFTLVFNNVNVNSP